MGTFFLALLIIIGVLSVIGFVRYTLTLPERRENDERLRQETLLFEEKCKAEIAKQNARLLGELARKKIDEIANPK